MYELRSHDSRSVERRKALFKKIKQTHADKNGVLLLLGDVEHDRQTFFQDSSFWYFVELNEPSLFFCQDQVTHESRLYQPEYTVDRSVWLPVKITDQDRKEAGIDTVVAAGKPVHGYEMGQFITADIVSNLLTYLEEAIAAKKVIYTPVTTMSDGARCLFEQLCYFLPVLRAHVIDISPEVGQLRRNKSHYELEQIYRAVELTGIAHDTAYEEVAAGKNEADVQGIMDYVMTQGHARHAYTPIVGSGKNGTILHYADNNKDMQKGELVVVDAGASYNHYAADVTRTYPVSGRFTARQKEVYNVVLAVQEEIAALACPGMFLNNPNYPDQSLHHRAKKLFEKAGYDQYFPHGIGHFIGLDVHDVGDRMEPLQEGDVITIEPGIYIPQESLGIRIEDMYWIVEDGSVCLTEDIPKTIQDLERTDRH